MYCLTIESLASRCRGTRTTTVGARPCSLLPCWRRYGKIQTRASGHAMLSRGQTGNGVVTRGPHAGLSSGLERTSSLQASSSVHLIGRVRRACCLAPGAKSTEWIDRGAYDARPSARTTIGSTSATRFHGLLSSRTDPALARPSSATRLNLTCLQPTRSARPFRQSHGCAPLHPSEAITMTCFDALDRPPTSSSMGSTASLVI